MIVGTGALLWLPESHYDWKYFCRHWETVQAHEDFVTMVCCQHSCNHGNAAFFYVSATYTKSLKCSCNIPRWSVLVSLYSQVKFAVFDICGLYTVSFTSLQCPSVASSACRLFHVPQESPAGSMCSWCPESRRSSSVSPDLLRHQSAPVWRRRAAEKEVPLPHQG